MSSKKSWLPAWAQKIGQVTHGKYSPVLAFGPAGLIEPGDLSDGEKKAIAAETSGPTPFEVMRCAGCGGATELKEPTSRGEEVRRCVRCGSISKESSPA